MVNPLSKANARSVAQECTRLEANFLEGPSKELNNPSRNNKSPALFNKSSNPGFFIEKLYRLVFPEAVF